MKKKNSTILEWVACHPFFSLTGGVLLAWLAEPFLGQGLLFFGLVLVALCLITLEFQRRGTLTAQRILLIVGVLSLALHLVYILATPYSTRQNDVDFIGKTTGHLAYMDYILTHHFSLPDFDPRTVWQFYHPPLHHFLGALWLRINLGLGASMLQAVENLQFLTLYYSGLLLILCGKFFRALGLKGSGLLVAFALVAFHPIVILLSGNLNNDILSLALSMGALLFAVRWYKEPTLKNILKTALFLGFSMVAKASGALMIPAIALLFVVKFFQEQEKGRLLPQFGLFALVSIPVGTSWAVYNFFRWGMPLNYVPSPPLPNPEYLGAYSNIERFFSFGPTLLENVFRTLGNIPQNYNVFVGLLKTSTFGEGAFFPPGSLAYMASVVLFLVNLLLVSFSLVAMVWLFWKRREKLSGTVKVFLGVVYVTLLGSYLNFNWNYPQMSTYHYRYIPFTMVIGALALGFWQTDREKMGRGTLVLPVLVLAFVALVILVFFRLAMVS